MPSWSPLLSDEAARPYTDMIELIFEGLSAQALPPLDPGHALLHLRGDCARPPGCDVIHRTVLGPDAPLFNRASNRSICLYADLSGPLRANATDGERPARK